MPEPGEGTGPGGGRPDWRRLLGERLELSALPGPRGAEVVEELADILEAECAAAGVDPEDGAAVRRWLDRQDPGPWSELARELAAGQRRFERRRAGTGPGSRRPYSWRRWGMKGWSMDLRGALRSWIGDPLLAAVAVATLAVAIGLNAAIFSLVDAALLRPPPVAEPESLVRVYSSEPDGFLPHQPMSYPDFADLRDGLGGVSRAFAHCMTQVALEGDGRPQLVFGELVTGGYFPALGLEPAAGRLFGEEADRLGDPEAVVVLGHGLWRRRFGGDLGVVGRVVRVNGAPLTVVGVAPAGFRGLLAGIEPQLWIPASLGETLGASSTTNAGDRDPSRSIYHDRGRRWLWVVGRRAQGTSLAAARTEIESLGQRLQAAHPDTNEEVSFLTLPLLDVTVLPGVDGGIRLASGLLLGVVGLVLLIACANLANLLLARALGRRREIATRLSLGATRRRIALQLLAESLLLALAGGALGLPLAWGAKAALREIRLGSLPISFGLEVDGRVLLFTFGVSLLAAVLCSLAPVLQTARAELAGVLREGDRRGGGLRRRLQSALVAAQVFFSTILLVCGGLALRSVVEAGRIDPGFDAPEEVAVLRLDLDIQGYDREGSEALFDRLIEEAAALPGVTAVSEASHLPLSLWINTWSFAPAGDGDPEPREVDVATVGPGYFETLGIRILDGRGFAPRDLPEAGRVAVINEELAERFWPGETAVGKSLRAGDDAYRVVGVVETGRYRTLGESPRPYAYVSFDQHPAAGRNLLVRYREGMEPRLDAIRRLVAAEDPHLALSDLSTLEEVTRPALILPRAGSALFGALGLLGLALASLGLYGVLAYAVAQRTHEIGVRVAMGADRRDVLGMVMRQGLLLTGAGALAGLAAAALVTGLLRSILYGVSPHDPATFLAVGVCFLVVASLACLLPARRATAVDPMEALRAD